MPVVVPVAVCVVSMPVVVSVAVPVFSMIAWSMPVIHIRNGNE
jgi:hypothetical protein